MELDSLEMGLGALVLTVGLRSVDQYLNGGNLQIEDREQCLPETLAEFQKDREWSKNITTSNR